MKMMVCTDGSENSGKALGKTVALAKDCKSCQVSVIHVYNEKTSVAAALLKQEYATGVRDMDELKEKLRQENEDILENAAVFFKKNGIESKKIFRQGNAAENIVAAAKEEDANIKILGSRGKGGLKKLFLGSVSNAVLNEIEGRSVLIVK